MGATPFYVSFIFFIFCTFVLKSLLLSINLSISLSSRFHKFKTMNAVNLGMQTTLFHRFSRILPLSLIADFQELTKTHQRRCLGDTMSKPQAFTSCNALPPLSEHLTKSDYTSTNCKITHQIFLAPGPILNKLYEFVRPFLTIFVWYVLCFVFCFTLAVSLLPPSSPILRYASKHITSAGIY